MTGGYFESTAAGKRTLECLRGNVSPPDCEMRIIRNPNQICNLFGVRNLLFRQITMVYRYGFFSTRPLGIFQIMIKGKKILERQLTH